MSYYNNVTASFGDSPSIDAFARLRVSNPYTLFDSKQIHSKQPLFWDDQEVSGGSTTSTWNQDTASTVLAVGATTAGNRVRQTFMRHNYQPGKSQLIFATGTLDLSGGGTGITRSLGYYDDNNGVFILDDEGTYKLVKRTYTSGSAVDTEVAQSSWNLDVMDGTGASGVTLDFTKSMILMVDFEWLGVGRLRMGFVIGGVPIYVHEFLHANSLQGVYMSTPNLPLRCEITNDGTGAASSIEHICGTVISEGGVQAVGVNHTHATEDTAINANTSGTKYALVGIKLKAANLDATVELVSASIMTATADDYHWEIIHNPTVAGSPSWSDKTNSTVQVAIGEGSNPSTTTVTGGHVMASGYAKSGTNSGAIEANIRSQLRLGAAIDGTVDEQWLVVMPLSSNADVYGAMSWREIS
jgi:hypothetical protein